MNLTVFLQEQPLVFSLAVFAIGALLIGVFGVRITYLARELARETGVGQAFIGAFFIGATTSLSGIVASATAAAGGSAGMAVSNSLGGIAAQTVFLVLADMLYRKSNLEFAAASIENMMMSAQLLILLSILLVAMSMPGASVLGVHPASPLLLVVYLYTLRLLVGAHAEPMWLPRMSRGTVTEGSVQDPALKQRAGDGSRSGLYWWFAVSAAVVAFAGWLLASAGIVMVSRTGLSAGVVGGVLIAVTTSLPELVIAVTAIRMGALTLAVADIVGGSAFDTLFVAVADFFYRPGPIYAAVEETEELWLACAMTMNAILLMGLLYRQKRGPANIGVESWAMLLCYLGTVSYLLRW